MNGELEFRMAWLFLIVVCGIAALVKLDSHLHKAADKIFFLGAPKDFRLPVFKKYITRVGDWCKWFIKRFWVWCKFLWENPASLFLALAGLLIFIALAVFGFDVYKIYVVLSDQIKGNEVIPDDYRSIAIRYFGIIAAVGAVIGYIIAISRNITANNQNKINQQGQITESMVQAIAQIGAVNGDKPNIEVRLGGLYSLQRIMQDSPKDELSIVKIFYAYVRENAKRDKTEQAEKKPPQPREDVQAALDIINQFDKGLSGRDKEFLFNSRINLSRTDFRGYSIANMDFSYAVLEDADLSGLNLSELHFFEANLARADLVGVDLTHADLDGAKLNNADLSGATLDVAWMPHAVLSRANLYRASLNNVDLPSAELDRVNLSGSRICFSNFDCINLHRANLSDVKFDDTHLNNANLYGANLNGADLSSARNLTQEQINVANGNKKTKLPKGLIRPDHWEKKPAKKIRTTDTKTKKIKVVVNKTQKPATKANKTQNSTTKD